MTAPRLEKRHGLPKPRFDLIPPDTTGPDFPVAVWIPVRRKA